MIIMTTMIKKIGHQITIFQDEKGFLLSTNTKPQIDVLEAKVFHLNQEEYVSTLFTFGGVTLPFNYPPLTSRGSLKWGIANQIII